MKRVVQSAVAVLAVLCACRAKAEIWLSPNLRSADYRALMDSNWNRPKLVDVFKFHSANLGNDTSVVGSNTLDETLARNGFARLLSFGMQLAIESGVIKPPADGNTQFCTGEVWRDAAVKWIDTVQNNGGVVSYIAMDEPLVQTTSGCRVSYSDAVTRTAEFISQVGSAWPGVQFVDIEPYPALNSSEIARFVWDLVVQQGRPLKGLHLDINREVLYLPDHEAELVWLANFVHQYGVRFGLILWSQRVGTNEAYVEDVLMEYAQTPNLRAVTDDLIFQSWHPSANGYLDMPLNVWNESANHLSAIRSAARYSSYLQGQSYCGIQVSEPEYIGFYPDINYAQRSYGLNPFLHYKLFGRNEGRCEIMHPCTSPLSAADYLNLYEDVREAGIDPWTHYILFGQDEGRCPIQ